jgi:hypothetical protein
VAKVLRAAGLDRMLSHGLFLPWHIERADRLQRLFDAVSNIFTFLKQSILSEYFDVKASLLRKGVIAPILRALDLGASSITADKRRAIMSGLSLVNTLVSSPVAAFLSGNIKQFAREGGVCEIRYLWTDLEARRHMPDIIAALATVDTRAEVKQSLIARAWARRRHLALDRDLSRKMSKAGEDWRHERKEDVADSLAVGAHGPRA